MEETTEKPEEPKEEVPSDTSELEAKNRQLFERAKKAEAEAKVARLEAERLAKGKAKGLDVEDYIDISASLEGLDQREKQFLAEQHKLSGKSLQDIRQSEDFTLWQAAYREKVAKEKSLAPSNTQPESDRPKTFMDELKSASTLAEKEAFLRKKGLYLDPRKRADRVDIKVQG